MHISVESYPAAAVERAMKIEEVLLRAAAGKIMWCQAAEMIRISDRQLRRLRGRYDKRGCNRVHRVPDGLRIKHKEHLIHCTALQDQVRRLCLRLLPQQHQESSLVLV